MAIGENIQAWRLARGQTIDAVCTATSLSAEILTAIEAGHQDPSASTVESLASALGLPAAWLYSPPKQFHLLLHDPDETDASPTLDLRAETVDPITKRILAATGSHRELYVLLTALLDKGDEKQIRAAELSLRSLLKQARQTALPWQSRPPGHFEPPSD